jgi:hypothetical protein
VEFAGAYYLPDLSLVGHAYYARAHVVADPPSAFDYDPYNRSGVDLALLFRRTLDLGACTRVSCARERGPSETVAS